MSLEKLSRIQWLTPQELQPTCIGTGLVALDIIVDSTTDSLPSLRAGGSCGNVLTILSYFGWKVFPIARLRDDPAAAKLVEDLAAWSVNTDFVSRTVDGSTPVIMERIRHNKRGVPFHKFEWICPSCGSWFPRYKPVLARDVPQICTQMPTAQIFYFDRPTRSALELAKASKSQGAITFFEPSAVLDQNLFDEGLHIADIVKYSDDRLGNLPELTERLPIPLEVKTMGASGLRYRRVQQSGRKGRWEELPAYPVLNFKDAAGAGDWCSAGLIHSLWGLGRLGLRDAPDTDIRNAFAFGQALASASCAFTGPRGNMYDITPQRFEELVISTLQGKTSIILDLPDRTSPASKQAEVWRNVCSVCQGNGSTGAAALNSEDKIEESINM